jgi:hypothetical protein
MAKQMGAETIEIEASHLALISQAADATGGAAADQTLDLVGCAPQ